MTAFPGIQLSVANVCFHLSSPQGGLLPASTARYAEFHASAPSDEPDLDCAVSIEYGPIAVPSGAREIFVSGRSWSVLEDAQGRRLIRRLPPEGSKEFAAWLATPSPDLRSLAVRARAASGPAVRADERREHPFRYPLDLITLTHILSLHEGVLLHAAGIRFGGRAFVLPGRSGRGKSTISRLLAPCERFTILSDDRVAVRARASGIRAYGTPWPGEGGFAVNAGFPLAALLFIEHGPGNHLQPLAPAETVARLMPVASIPWYEQRLADGALAFCDRLVREVPAYELQFAPTADVADFLANACAELTA